VPHNRLSCDGSRGSVEHRRRRENTAGPQVKYLSDLQLSWLGLGLRRGSDEGNAHRGGRGEKTVSSGLPLDEATHGTIINFTYDNLTYLELIATCMERGRSSGRIDT
jgi:hypothetical protein